MASNLELFQALLEALSVIHNSKFIIPNSEPSPSIILHHFPLPTSSNVG